MNKDKLFHTQDTKPWNLEGHNSKGRELEPNAFYYCENQPSENFECENVTPANKNSDYFIGMKHPEYPFICSECHVKGENND